MAHNDVAPEKWRFLWDYLHILSTSHPDKPTQKDKDDMFMFFMHLKLPCHTCQNNYRNHLKKIPLTDKILRKRERLIKWVIDIHNEVNKMKGKKVLTYDDAIKQILKYL
jgi:hypothetical protein